MRAMRAPTAAQPTPIPAVAPVDSPFEPVLAIPLLVADGKAELMELELTPKFCAEVEDVPGPVDVEEADGSGAINNTVVYVVCGKVRTVVTASCVPAPVAILRVVVTTIPFGTVRVVATGIDILTSLPLTFKKLLSSSSERVSSRKRSRGTIPPFHRIKTQDLASTTHLRGTLPCLKLHLSQDHHKSFNAIILMATIAPSINYFTG
jgi:hypothetical protein